VPVRETSCPARFLHTLFRNPKTGRTASFKSEELAQLDGMATDYLLNYYLAQSVFTADDLTRLRNSIEAHTQRLYQLMRNSDWRARVFNYEVAKEKPSCAACCNCACWLNACKSSRRAANRQTHWRRGI